MDTYLELQEFFVEGKDQKKSHVLLHIAEPVSQHEKERGYFFVVAEINDGYEEQIEHIQQLINDIETAYYDKETSEKNTLENVLHDINRQGHHVLQYQNTEIHCAVGAISKNNLSIAYHGTPSAVLFYLSKETLRYTKIIDANEYKESEHLFPEIIGGEVNAGDYIYISTPHVTDLFSYDRVRKILDSRTVRQSALHIQKALEGMRDELSYGGILFHITNKVDTAGSIKPKQSEHGSKESLNLLLASAKQTEETLSPPMFGRLRSKIKEKLEKDRLVKFDKKEKKKAENKKKEKEAALQRREHRQYRIETNYRRSEESAPLFDRVLAGLGGGILFLFAFLAKVLKKLLRVCARVIQTLFILITNRGRGRQEKILAWKSSVDKNKKFITGLPLISKILLILTVALGMAFMGSIAYLKIKENKDARVLSYDNTIQGVIDKKDAAEAALVYNEKKKAFELLQEAHLLIEKMPQKNKEQKAKAEELKSELEIFLRKLRNMTVVTPEVLVDLNEADSSAKAEKIIKAGQQIIAFGHEDGNLYTVNILTKKVAAKAYEAIKRTVGAAVPKELDKIIFVTSDNMITEYNLETETLLKKTIDYPSADVEISSIGTYNRKLYTLDKKNGQIYKHSQTQTGYDRGSSWIKSQLSNLQDGISLSIDGEIYALQSNGELLKFFGGDKKEFSITGLDPILQNPSIVWTDGEADNIYILEKNEKRVIIIKKDGTFVKQFTAYEWEDPKGMAVDEENRVIYILDNNIIYSFGL